MQYDYSGMLFSEPSDGVLLVTLNRPERYNATDAQMHAGLARLFAQIDRDEDAKVVVITGNGDGFCAGGDFDMISDDQDNHARRVQVMRETWEIAYGIIECRKPIVSAINGSAAGIGLAIGLLADISIVSETAVLADGHAPLGLVAGDHMALIWPLLCSLAKAKLYALTGRRLSGLEAERIGLVSQAVPTEDVLGTALSAAEELATKAPLALEFTKRTLNHWVRAAMPTFEASMGYEMVTSFDPDLSRRLAAVRSPRG